MDFKDALSIVYPDKTFDGSDFHKPRDEARITGQLEAIHRVMKSGLSYTLREIAQLTGAPESSVSAQLRNLRKKQFGGHTIAKQHIKNGLFAYQLVMNQSPKN